MPKIGAIFLFLLLSVSFAPGSPPAVRVEIDGLRGEALDNVRLFVGTPPGDNPQLLRRFARNAADRARDALQALGHYDADVRLSTGRDGDALVLRFAIDPGEPVRLASIAIAVEGEAADDPAFAARLAALPLRKGDVLHHGRYEDAKSAIESLALSRGYFQGAFARHRLVVRPDDRDADVDLLYVSGPRHRFGPVNIPATPLREKLLMRLVPFRPGDPYLAENVALLHANLVDSEYFDDVGVRPRPDDADADLRVPVDVDLGMAPRNRVGLGVGLATDVGPRLRLEWKRPWLNRLGHSGQVKSEMSWVRQNLSAQYSIPLNPPLRHQLQFSAGWKGENLEDTQSQSLRAAVQLRRVFGNGWTVIPFLRWEQEKFTQADVRDTTTLALPGLSLDRTRRKGGAIPDKGDRLFALVETAHPEFLSDMRLSRVLLQARRIDTWRSHRLSASLEYGALATDDFDRTPPSLRFFAGGDQSVRGFGYQTLAPKNDEGELVGGRYLLAASLEYNYALAPKWRAAVFYDVGNASADASFSAGFAQGAGVGLRWLSPIAPIKLDFAWGVSEPNPPFRVHFSMGTDL
jgi:translocation and assembly module TamA